jgi:hypothetical protein
MLKNHQHTYKKYKFKKTSISCPISFKRYHTVTALFDNLEDECAKNEEKKTKHVFGLRGEENGEYDDVEDDGDEIDRQADHDLLHPILYSTRHMTAIIRKG